MRGMFDIQFFGGGGSSTQTIRKRDPEPEELTNLRKSLYGAITPSVEMFDPAGWKKAQGIADDATKRQQELLERQQGLLGKIPGTLDRSNEILDEMMSVVRSGAVPSALTDAANASVMKGLRGSMGNMLNGLSNRGVVNSSIASKGINGLAQNAADAMNTNYLNAFNSVVGGYGQGLAGAQNNTASLLGAANAMNTGINTLGGIPAQAYENAGAALMPAFNLWKAAQSSYDNREDYDTVVQQGK